jgi:hypothetical protein
MSERHWQRPATGHAQSLTAAQLKGALLTKVGTAPGHVYSARALVSWRHCSR